MKLIIQENHNHLKYTDGGGGDYSNSEICSEINIFKPYEIELCCIMKNVDSIEMARRINDLCKKTNYTIEHRDGKIFMVRII